MKGDSRHVPFSIDNQQPLTPAVIPCKAKHDELEAHSRLRRNALPRLAGSARSVDRPGPSGRRHPPHRGRASPAARLRPHRHGRPRARSGSFLHHRSPHPGRQPPPSSQPLPPAQHPRPLGRNRLSGLPRPTQRPLQILRIPNLPAPRSHWAGPDLSTDPRAVRLALPLAPRSSRPQRRRRPRSGHP